MKALTIRQPWAWAIIHAGKDVENRTWRTSFRGRLLIHAASHRSASYFAAASQFIERIGIIVPDSESLPRGGIVGAVSVTDCVDESASKWWMGPRGLVLRDAEPLDFVAISGALGLWECSEAVAEKSGVVYGAAVDTPPRVSIIRP